MADQRIGAEVLRRFVVTLLRALDVDEVDADCVAQVLVWADRHGRPNQGVTWLPTLVRRFDAGLLRSPTEMRVDGHAAVAVIDAGHGFGQRAGLQATDEAMRRASAFGVGMSAVRNSHHFGAAGAYACHIADCGKIGLVFSNAVPKVAPHGGVTPVLGTNPLAIACPTSGDPLVVDLATSATAGSSVRRMLADDRPVPPELAVGPAGDVLRPLAGAKGTALGIGVEILTGILAGGVEGREVGSMFALDRAVGTSHSFFVLDADVFGGPDGIRERADRLVESVRSSERQAGVEEILLPGEARARARRHSDVAGVALGPRVVTELEALAARADLSVPWQS